MVILFIFYSTDSSNLFILRTYSTPQHIFCCVLQLLLYLLSEGNECRLYYSCGAQYNPLNGLLRHMEVQLGKHLPVRKGGEINVKIRQMFLIDKSIYMRNSRLEVIELMMRDDDEEHHGGQAVAGHMPYYWGGRMSGCVGLVLTTTHCTENYGGTQQPLCLLQKLYGSAKGHLDYDSRDFDLWAECVSSAQTNPNDLPVENVPVTELLSCGVGRDVVVQVDKLWEVIFDNLCSHH